MKTFHIVNVNSEIDIESLTDGFNRSQSSFILKQLDNNFSISNNTVNRKEFFNFYQGKIKDDVSYIIGITSNQLDKNFFSDVSRKFKVAIISTHESEIYSPPFKIEDYIEAEILLSILLMSSKMDIGHNDTRGCLFDFCGNKNDIVVKLHSGSICADCRARLLYYGVTDYEVMSSQRILWKISKDFYSDNVGKGCPVGHGVCKELQNIKREYSDRNIFLAISFGTEFHDMSDHLKTKLKNSGFSLKVVNSEISNKSLLCKICNTIQICKYGIAEFSGFRHNVSYEFGLMQAFGLKTIGIISKNKLDDFEKQVSDMKGIEIIPYENVVRDLYQKIETFISA
ncbi:hypothetical protein MCHI_001073 [Candidatus Magnetoovum chiemensis]|nr:hypothetical protein MCHI_001073 [Candidatus Magnetoovum chiemensis]